MAHQSGFGCIFGKAAAKNPRKDAILNTLTISSEFESVSDACQAIHEMGPQRTLCR